MPKLPLRRSNKAYLAFPSTLLTVYTSWVWSPFPWCLRSSFAVAGLSYRKERFQTSPGTCFHLWKFEFRRPILHYLSVNLPFEAAGYWTLSQYYSLILSALLSGIYILTLILIPSQPSLTASWIPCSPLSQKPTYQQSDFCQTSCSSRITLLWHGHNWTLFNHISPSPEISSSSHHHTWTDTCPDSRSWCSHGPTSPASCQLCSSSLEPWHIGFESTSSLNQSTRGYPWVHAGLGLDISTHTFYYARWIAPLRLLSPWHQCVYNLVCSIAKDDLDRQNCAELFQTSLSQNMPTPISGLDWTALGWIGLESVSWLDPRLNRNVRKVWTAAIFYSDSEVNRRFVFLAQKWTGPAGNSRACVDYVNSGFQCSASIGLWRIPASNFDFLLFDPDFDSRMAGP